MTTYPCESTPRKRVNQFVDFCYTWAHSISPQWLSVPYQWY